MLKLIKGATKPKAAAPKAKYIEPILGATFERNPQSFEQAMDALTRTISKSPAWTTVYKALIVVHIMIREGEKDVTLKYLSRHPRMLEVEDEVARQTVGLAKYARYLSVRAAQYKDTRVDYVRYRTRGGQGGQTRLHSLSIDKGLVRECESVIIQIDSLIKTHFDERDVDNDVVLMAFRLLVHDLLSLFQTLNEGVINLLEHFFELGRYDAEEALEVYKGFTRLTNKVIAYLKVAKNLEYQTKFHVPNIKHAPTSLVSSLEMYLNDPDFDINRRQYLAEKQAHVSRKHSEADLPARSQSQREPIRTQTNASQAAGRSVSASLPPAAWYADTQQQQSQQPQGQPQALQQQQYAQQQIGQQLNPQQPQQPQHPQQPQQQLGTVQGQTQAPQGILDLLTGDISNSAGASFTTPQQAPAASFNPFYNQVQQELSNAQQIQLGQAQAQYQMQQLQLQQAQQQQQQQQQQVTGQPQMYVHQQQPQQQQLYQQVTGGLQQAPTGQLQSGNPQNGGDQWSSFDFGQGQQSNVGFSQSYQAQAPQYQQQQVTGQQQGSLQYQGMATPPGQVQQAHNPFKRASVSPGTNPFAAQQTGATLPVTPQMTAQETGRNPFRQSLH